MGTNIQRRGILTIVYDFEHTSLLIDLFEVVGDSVAFLPYLYSTYHNTRGRSCGHRLLLAGWLDPLTGCRFGTYDVCGARQLGFS